MRIMWSTHLARRLTTLATTPCRSHESHCTRHPTIHSGSAITPTSLPRHMAAAALRQIDSLPAPLPCRSKPRCWTKMGTRCSESGEACSECGSTWSTRERRSRTGTIAVDWQARGHCLPSSSDDPGCQRHPQAVPGRWNLLRRCRIPVASGRSYGLRRDWPGQPAMFHHKHCSRFPSDSRAPRDDDHIPAVRPGTQRPGDYLPCHPAVVLNRTSRREGAPR